jgi:hypothetical protein
LGGSWREKVKTLLAAARREHPNAQIDCEWATRRLPAKKSIVRTSRATGKRANPRARGHPGVVWELAQMKIDFSPSQTRGNVYYIFTGAAGAAA